MVYILQELNDNTFPTILFHLFQLYIHLGVTPHRWNKSYIFPIPKTSTSKYIKDFRPVSITILFRKIFEALLLDFLNDKLKNNNFMSQPSWL